MATIIVSKNTTGTFTNTGYTGVNDTRTRGLSPTTNYASSTTLDTTCWDLSEQDVTTTFIKFDLTGIGAGTVTNAEFGLWLTIGNNDFRSIDLYALLVDFVDTEATYLIRKTGVDWDEPDARGSGTDRDATPIATATRSSTSDIWMTFSGSGLNALIEDYLDGTRTNNGFTLELTDYSDDLFSYQTFASSEGADGNRPYLKFDHTASAGGTATGSYTSSISVANNQTNTFTSSSSVRNNANGSYSSAYKLLNNATGTFGGSASVRNAQTNNYTYSFTLSNATSSSYIAAFSLRNTQTQTFTGASSVLNTQTGTFNGAFSLEQAGVATGSFNSSFTVANSVTTSATFSASVANGQTNSFNGAFSVRQIAIGTYNGAFTVYNIASGSYASSFTVANIASTVFTSAYSVLNQASNSYTSAFSIEALGSALGSFNTAFSARNNATGTYAGASSIGGDVYGARKSQVAQRETTRLNVQTSSRRSNTQSRKRT